MIINLGGGGERASTVGVFSWMEARRDLGLLPKRIGSFCLELRCHIAPGCKVYLGVRLESGWGAYFRGNTLGIWLGGGLLLQKWASLVGGNGKEACEEGKTPKGIALLPACVTFDGSRSPGSKT